MTTIRRTTVITLVLLLILSGVVTADAQRRVGRIRQPSGGGCGGAQVRGGREFHPWPAATCPICATRVARAIAEQRTARGLSSQVMSADELNALLKNSRVEVNPALVRSRIDVARDHESLARANAESRGTTYTVEVESRTAPNGRATYIVNDGSGEPIYVGSDYKAMINRVKQRAGSKSINVIPRNLSRAKADGLRSTFRLQQGRVSTRAAIELPEAGRSAASARAGYSARGARLVEGSVTQPVLVKQGRFKGFYTASLRFVSAGRQLTLRVYVKSKEALRSMLDTVAARLSNNSNRMSMERLVNQARTNLKSTYNLSDRDFLIQLEDELRNTFFVRTPRFALHKVA